MKKILLTLISGIFVMNTYGQVLIVTPPAEDQPAIRISSMNALKVADNINVDMQIDYDPLLLNRNEKYMVTPIIVKQNDTLGLRPVVFLASIQSKKENRMEAMYDEMPDYGNPYAKEEFSAGDMRTRKRQLKRYGKTENSSSNTIRYTASVPYERWMDGSMMVLKNEVVGCNDKGYHYYATLGTLYEPVEPKVTMVVPEREEVKMRSDKMTARITFQVDKYNIRRDLYNNDQELMRIYSFTDNVVNNKDIKVTEVKLIGYASPEAPYSYNDRLSRNRVESVRNELSGKYNFDRSIVSIENVPEDWDSLRRWIAASDQQYKSQLLDIIDNTSDPDARDGKIKALDNNYTYNYLLREVYPGLRRVDYTIAYTVTPFTVEQGKQVMRTAPHHLSLDELYQIASTYSEDSPEYEEVFNVAVTYFPEDPIANHNMAVLAIRKGDYQAARRYSEKCRDEDFALNTVGVLYVVDGDYQTASDYFRRANDLGLADAQYNQQNLYNLK